MYTSLHELKTATLAFLNSAEAIYSPHLSATAKRFLNRLTTLDRNSLSRIEVYDLLMENTIFPWLKEQTAQQLMVFILGGAQYA
ncbi:hypothetical protein JOC36_000227 [Weissella uvarum]|uniref:hypothetical protein n=1 Tax=Weissella uvarum TaxID=1479233 RepID=UPI0019602760|nr:hypothetical protein [Weissella uvarum]MBM7616694.1 hypothetical protein [Weissella uvarum]MCM0594851.1 hypothetical protein [Weissella uvarum]